MAPCAGSGLAFHGMAQAIGTVTIIPTRSPNFIKRPGSASTEALKAGAVPASFNPRSSIMVVQPIGRPRKASNRSNLVGLEYQVKKEPGKIPTVLEELTVQKQAETKQNTTKK